MSVPADEARVAQLRVDLTRDWDMVCQHLEHAGSVEPSANRASAALVALSLDHAYQAMETLLVRIERALGLAERTGSGWHRAILADAVQPLPGVRGPVLPAPSERDWDELRRFRHFLRHAYTVELDPDRLVPHVVRLERAVTLSDEGVRALIAGLASRH